MSLHTSEMPQAAQLKNSYLGKEGAGCARVSGIQCQEALHYLDLIALICEG